MAYSTTRFEYVHQTTFDLSAAANANVHTHHFAHRYRVIEWGFIVETTAIVHGTTVEGVESIECLDHDQSTVVELGTITVDADMALGHVEFRNLDGAGGTVALDVDPGQAIRFRHKTQPTGGVPAGSVKFFVRLHREGDRWSSTYHHQT